MSDSLKATVIVIEPVLTISTRPELLDDEDELLLEPPRLPAVAPVPELDPEPDPELDPEPEPEPDPDPLAETVSPGETSATLTTVPVAGAYRRVSLSAFSAFLTVAWAPSTAAWAEAMLAAIVSALVVLVCPEPEPEPDPPPDPDPLGEDERLGVVVVVVVRVGVVRVGVVRVGVVVVRVRVGDVVVREVVVVVGAVLVDVVVVCVAVVTAGWKVTNSVDSWTVSRLVLVDDPDVAVWFSALVRLSCAEVRFDSACSTVSSAAVGSSVAMSWPLTTWSPSLTERFCSVPPVWKLASTSVPGSTFPVPVTVDCTMPLAAVTTCVDVRAVLVGGPSSSTAATTAAASTAPIPRMCQGILILTQLPTLLAGRSPAQSA
jgi:hypothetical protein